MDTSVSILNVRSSFSLEGYHGIKVEVVTIHTICFKVVEFDSSDTDSMSNSFLVRQVWILSFDLSLGTVNSLSDSWLKQDNVTFTSRQFLTVLSYKTKGNVSHVVRPVVAHFFKNSFQLFEVSRLFITNHIDGFGKVVSTFTVEGSSQVTCDVECRTI